MTTNLARFNNQISALIKALKNIEAIQNDSAIELFELKYNTIKSIDSKIPLQCFLKYVYPYKEEIMNKNEEFFLGGDMNKRVNELSQNLKEDNSIAVESYKNDNEFVLHQALNIKQHWHNSINDKQRDTIWTYFQVLIKLAERYVAEKVL